MITPQYEHNPDMVARHFGPDSVKSLNVLAAITGQGYPISGDTLSDIKHAYPEQETP